MGEFWSEEVAMRRTHFFILVVFGMATATFAQTTSSDSQILQALLTEVRQLRQDLQASLTRMQSAQILLSRLQIQEVAVTRASQQVDETRSKLAEVQLVQKSQAAKVASLTSLKDEVSANPEQQGDVQDVQEKLNSAQSDLNATTDLAQQRQAIEIEAEQQLRTAQDKLNSLENQLDELVKDIRKPIAQATGQSFYWSFVAAHYDSHTNICYVMYDRFVRGLGRVLEQMKIDDIEGNNSAGYSGLWTSNRNGRPIYSKPSECEVKGTSYESMAEFDDLLGSSSQYS
jgi:myosin heavy subunit